METSRLLGIRNPATGGTEILPWPHPAQINELDDHLYCGISVEAADILLRATGWPEACELNGPLVRGQEMVYALAQHIKKFLDQMGYAAFSIVEVLFAMNYPGAALFLVFFLTCSSRVLVHGLLGDVAGGPAACNVSVHVPRCFPPLLKVGRQFLPTAEATGLPLSGAAGPRPVKMVLLGGDSCRLLLTVNETWQTLEEDFVSKSWN